MSVVNDWFTINKPAYVCLSCGAFRERYKIVILRRNAIFELEQFVQRRGFIPVLHVCSNVASLTFTTNYCCVFSYLHASHWLTDRDAQCLDLVVHFEEPCHYSHTIIT